MSTKVETILLNSYRKTARLWLFFCIKNHLFHALRDITFGTATPRGPVGKIALPYSGLRIPAAEAYHAQAAVINPKIPPGTLDMIPNSARSSNIKQISKKVNTASKALLILKVPIHM